MTQPDSLRGKRVLVVGGETATGRALAVGLAEAGASVAIATLTVDTEAEFAVNSALNELWAIGRKGVALSIDASDADQVRGAVEQGERELGRLDGAAVVRDERADLAVEALAEALAGRQVAMVPPGTTQEDALTMVAERIGDG